MKRYWNVVFILILILVPALSGCGGNSGNGGDGGAPISTPPSPIPPPSPTINALHVKPDSLSPDGKGLTWDTAFHTVQEAIDAAVSGDEIWVVAGTYSEKITLTKGVALYGGFVGTETGQNQRNWGENVTILDGGGSQESVVTVVDITNARIDGFTIRNGLGKPGNVDAKFGGGIYCQNSSLVISNCTIDGNGENAPELYGGGIFCEGSIVVIDNNTIKYNTADYGGGIYCSHTQITISNNTIIENWATNGGGIYCDTSEGTINNNIITGNTATNSHGGGIFCYYSPTSNIDNTINGNSGGDIFIEPWE